MTGQAGWSATIDILIPASDDSGKPLTPGQVADFVSETMRPLPFTDWRYSTDRPWIDRVTIPLPYVEGEFDVPEGTCPDCDEPMMFGGHIAGHRQHGCHGPTRCGDVVTELPGRTT